MGHFTKKQLFATAFAFVCSLAVMGQRQVRAVGRVADSQGDPCGYAAIRITATGAKPVTVTADEEGRFAVAGIRPGRVEMTVTLVGYERTVRRLTITKDTTLDLTMKHAGGTLREVVVTAREGKGLTSSSRIDRTAMEHLQPTSFRDLLAMIPGGQTRPPVMSGPSHILLRGVGVGSDDYATSALGTQFVIDGAPLSTSAEMQVVGQEVNAGHGGRTSINRGVDMRSLSTDNIESVEIVRGIPSVQYGDITSGVVLIERKLRPTPFEARIKADEYGKLFSLGKGFDIVPWNMTLAADLTYLHSQADPRDRLDGFRRITASLRSSKKWDSMNGNVLRWTSQLDYTANIDKAKSDPEIHTQREDNYHATYNRLHWNHALTLLGSPNAFFRKLALRASADYSWEKIERSRFVQLDRDHIAMTNTESGVFNAYVLPYTYVASLTVDGKPLHLSADVKGDFFGRTGRLTHGLSAGLGWKFDKNYGAGQVFDMTRPLNANNVSRPRRYDEIPGAHHVSFYAEDRMGMSLGAHRLTLQAGLRGAMLLGIDRQYDLAGRLSLDPRFNFQWALPAVRLAGHDLQADLTAGWGWFTLSPTLSMLYPDKAYIDILQLNYWNANPALKLINVRSYVIDRAPYRLKAARNRKWEVRLGASYRHNQLSVTYFHEDMKSGFRSMAAYAPYSYNKYDASTLAGSTLTAPIDLAALPCTPTTVLRGYDYTGNGSRTKKEGVEFQYSSPRFKGINTRFTLNGAWFRTTYENSLPLFDPVSTVIGNQAVSDHYIGLYNANESYVRERFSTNLTVDTWLEKLATKLSATVECTWFTASQNGQGDDRPTHYLDKEGRLNPYTDAAAADNVLRHLTVYHDPSVSERSTTPMLFYVNFKATKDFGRHVSLSLFADRLLDYVPDYRRKGYEIRRTPEDAYFGMELNLKF